MVLVKVKELQLLQAVQAQHEIGSLHKFTASVKFLKLAQRTLRLIIKLA